MVAGQSALLSAYATNPLKILVPRARGTSVWICTSSFGGGMVAGDKTTFEADVGPMARCFVGSQASTKVYRNPARLPCEHRTHARVGPGSLLVYAPDPVQPFGGALYRQRQEFHLSASSNLTVLDWLSAGRGSRGERWAFTEFSSHNEVWRDDRRLYLDALRLDPTDGNFSSTSRGGRFHSLATLLILGPLLESLSAAVLREVADRGVNRRAVTVASASPVPGGVVLRIASETVEAVGRELRPWLNELSAWLGDNPWSRKG
jgi:urease accessory protein